MAFPTYPTVRLPKGRTIVIDGSLHEWPQPIPGILLGDPRQLSGTANRSFRGPSDCSAQAGMVWDSDYLYLFVLIRDDWGRAYAGRGTRVLIPSCDTVQLTFDPKRNSRRHGSDPGRKEDREFWFGMTHSGKSFVVRREPLTGKATDKVGTKSRMLYDKKKRLFTLEAAIPWTSLLGMNPPKKDRRTRHADRDQRLRRTD